MGAYKNVTPVGAQSVILEEGVAYVLEVWAEDGQRHWSIRVVIRH